MSRLHLITVMVNGRTINREVEPRLLLVDFLRNDLGLTGTHVGCETSQCGCCVVLLGNPSEPGQACKSCTLLAVQASGLEVTTIEGLTADGPAGGSSIPERAPAIPSTPSPLHPIQEAFRLKHGLQCGFCTPGMVMLAVDLLSRRRHPTEAEIRDALHGNMCRCTGYQHIVDAILEAAVRMPPSECTAGSATALEQSA